MLTDGKCMNSACVGTMCSRPGCMAVMLSRNFGNVFLSPSTRPLSKPMPTDAWCSSTHKPRLNMIVCRQLIGKTKLSVSHTAAHEMMKPLRGSEVLLCQAVCSIDCVKI